MLNIFFNAHPVFTRREFEEFLISRGTTNPETWKSLLYHHRKKHNIAMIKKGLYLAIPPGSEEDSLPVDGFLIASRCKEDAILAYHTALEVHGRAHSLHEQYIYLTESASHRPFSFRNILYRAIPFPKILQVKKKSFWGVETIDRSGLDARVTSLERTLVDVLHRPELCGGWEEVWRSLSTVEYYDLEQLIEYALLLENATTIAKTGFFLEQHKKSLMVEEFHLKRLEEFKPKQPHYLNRGHRSGRLVSRWNLVVPEAVLNKTWEEL